jgi:hypothetical protein
MISSYSGHDENRDDDKKSVTTSSTIDLQRRRYLCMMLKKSVPSPKFSSFQNAWSWKLFRKVYELQSEIKSSFIVPPFQTFPKTVHQSKGTRQNIGTTEQFYLWQMLLIGRALT